MEMMLVYIFVCLLLPRFGVLCDGNNLTIDEDLELERQLKILNKPAIKTILDDGDIYDCVHIQNQPAFDHPSLKNHKIQLRPSSYPDGLFDDFSISSTNNSMRIGLKDGNTCPSGTVPIKRVSKEDLIRMRSSLKNRKMMNSPSNLSDANQETRYNQWAIYFTPDNGEYYGASASINAYGLPQVKKPQYSSSLIWIANNLNQDQINLITFGWTVDEFLYGDSQTRLMTTWTNDNYATTGCQDIKCPGFVQINDEIPLGGTIHPLSTYGGDQYTLNVLVFQDIKSKNWWLTFGKDKKIVGYWPNEIFTHLNSSANRIDYGGVVQYSDISQKPPMGSGHFSNEGFGKSCFFDNLQYVNSGNTMQYMVSVSPYASSPQCYDLGPYFQTGNDMNNMFYFGGPGDC